MIITNISSFMVMALAKPKQCLTWVIETKLFVKVNMTKKLM